METPARCPSQLNSEGMAAKACLSGLRMNKNVNECRMDIPPSKV